MNPPSREFTVGALSFRLDAATGFVRTIRFQGHEILRGIYPALRDPDWRTLVPAVAPPVVDATPDRVMIELSARISSGAIGLEWHASIVARAEGELSYRWRARALTAFATNRTGLCVLHPAEIAGAPCTIEHADGSAGAAWFPQRISPHQPFRNVRAITHVFAPRAEVVVRMDGEVFETEDQRNWTDASFKTYCRPLDWPRPYSLAADSVIEHAVTVAVRGRPASRRASAHVARLLAESASLPLPRIGFTAAAPIPAALRERMHALRPSHLRIETTPDELEAALAWAREEAARAGCELDVAIRGASATPARTLLPARGVVHLFDANGNAVSAEVVAAWRHAGFPTLATGTLNHFTELNRQHPPANGEFDLTTFGINGQVHAFDDTSLLETLSQHGVVARHARDLGAGRAVCVAPIILGPTADAADERLHSGLGARWLLGSLVRLAATGVVERVTFFRTHGPGGFLREDRVTPTEELLLHLAGATHAHVLKTDDAPAGAVDALLLPAANAKPHRLFLGHDGDSPLQLEIPWSGDAAPLGGKPARFTAGRMTLPPHAVWQLQISA